MQVLGIGKEVNESNYFLDQNRDFEEQKKKIMLIKCKAANSSNYLNKEKNIFLIFIIEQSLIWAFIKETTLNIMINYIR